MGIPKFWLGLRQPSSFADLARPHFSFIASHTPFFMSFFFGFFTTWWGNSRSAVRCRRTSIPALAASPTNLGSVIQRAISCQNSAIQRTAELSLVLRHPPRGVRFRPLTFPCLLAFACSRPIHSAISGPPPLTGHVPGFLFTPHEIRVYLPASPLPSFSLRTPRRW